jgi:hypothetical protein
MLNNDLYRRVKFNVLKLACWRYITIGGFVTISSHALVIEWRNPITYALGTLHMPINADTRRRVMQLSSQSLQITEHR